MAVTQLGFWDYETETAVGEPDSGGIRADDPVTLLCVSTVDHDDVDHAAALAALTLGDVVEVRERTNALKWVRFEVTSAVVVQPGSPDWVQFDVTQVAASMVDQPKRGDDLVLTTITGASLAGGSLVTVEDYERLTGVDVPAEDEPRVQALLDAASAAVQGATGQTLGRARSTEPVVLEQWRQTLVLDEVPLYEADPDDALIVTDPDGEVVPRDHYDVDLKTSTLKHCDCHPWPPGCYTVEYSHGYDPVPPDLVALIVGSVQGVVAAPAGVQSRSVGSYSVTYRDGADVAGLGALGTGGGMLDRYRVPAPPMP
jgi:hypothetical protein